MKNKKALVFITVCSLIILAFFIYFTQEDRDRKAFSHSICQNLLDSNKIFDKSVCHISQNVPDVMNSMFPVGKVDIDYVQEGLRGFKQTRYSSGVVSTPHYPQCSPGDGWEGLQYRIIRKPLILWDELYEFVFCEGILVNSTWSE